jgi:D-arabinose 1-dehydrogenase-like Zn-dependent alcohol dehydrogenase
VGRPQVEARPLGDAEAALSELQNGKITGRAVLVP